MFVSLYIPRGYGSLLMDKGVEIRYNGRWLDVSYWDTRAYVVLLILCQKV